MENTKQIKILFITHKAKNCGVADYGLRVYSILKAQGWDITLCQADNIHEINIADDIYGMFDVFLYNYHYATLPFLTGKQRRPVKHVALYHEAFMNFEPDTIIPVPDLPRPLFEGTTFEKHNNVIPVIGSFGFGFADKNLPGLCQLVKEQFEYAKVKLLIPFAQYGDSEGNLARNEVDKCKAVLSGTNIELSVSHDFLPATNLLYWLSYNDINVFNYSPSHGRGLSSTIDYALSVRRPIAVSNSEMFRHLPAEICLDNATIPQLIAKGIEPLLPVYEANSNEKLADAIRRYL